MRGPSAIVGGFKLKRKNSNELDESEGKEKKSFSSNNNNRGGRGGFNQKRWKNIFQLISAVNFKLKYTF